jgi:hypothetical protein
MTNNKQQTAVEWLYDELFKSFQKFHTLQFTMEEYQANNVKLYLQAKEMEKEQSNAKINTAIKEFETLKSKANSLKDVVYLDGVLAVLDSIKNETYGDDKQ